MTSNKDFRVEQTYAEIEQYIEEAAASILTEDAYDPPGWYDAWARKTAKQIAEAAVRNLDAAE